MYGGGCLETQSNTRAPQGLVISPNVKGELNPQRCVASVRTWLSPTPPLRSHPPVITKRIRRQGTHLDWEAHSMRNLHKIRIQANVLAFQLSSRRAAGEPSVRMSRAGAVRRGAGARNGSRRICKRRGNPSGKWLAGVCARSGCGYNPHPACQPLFTPATRQSRRPAAPDPVSVSGERNRREFARRYC